MDYKTEEHLSWLADYQEEIENHKATKELMHPYSFLLVIEIDAKRVLVTLNDYSEKDFKDRLTACLRNGLYPFSLFHKNKYLEGVEHVLFLNNYSASMNKRGRKPSLNLSHRDTRVEVVRK